MRSIALHRVAALVLALLLGATSTGLPSHHHETGQAGPLLVNAGHHGHGVLLVDTSERVVTQGLFVALPSQRLAGVPSPTAGVLQYSVWAASQPPQAQPPPSARPRAPPVHG